MISIFSHSLFVFFLLWVQFASITCSSLLNCSILLLLLLCLLNHNHNKYSTWIFFLFSFHSIPDSGTKIFIQIKFIVRRENVPNLQNWWSEKENSTMMRFIRLWKKKQRWKILKLFCRMNFRCRLLNHCVYWMRKWRLQSF